MYSEFTILSFFVTIICCCFFSANALPKEDGEFYQFCYVASGNQVRGASTPFQVRISVYWSIALNPTQAPTAHNKLILYVSGIKGNDLLLVESFLLLISVK